MNRIRASALFAFFLALPVAALAADDAVPPPPPPPAADAVGVMPARLDNIDLKAASVAKPVTLQYDDVIRLVVIGHPELTQTARVQGDGRVTLPMVDEVPAEGRTLDQLRSDVRQRLLQINHGSNLIEPGDTLEITVWHEPELTHTSPVGPDGVVVFPLIGEVEAAGRSVADVRNDVQRELTQYLRDPKVSILPQSMTRSAFLSDSVLILPDQLRPRTAVVLGEVSQPGMQQLSGELRVMDLLALAHYDVSTAKLNSVLVIRNVNGKVPQYRLLHLQDYIDGKAPDQNIYLQAGDVVFVPKTIIAKVDEVLDQFFTRTKPLFDWWIGLNQARYAEQYNRALVQIYKNLSLVPTTSNP